MFRETMLCDVSEICATNLHSLRIRLLLFFLYPKQNRLTARSAHLEITYLEATYLEALLNLIPFLGFRVGFFPFMHDIQDCTSLNQPGIIRNFSQKKNFLAPNECWHFIFAAFFSSDVRISSTTQFLHPRIIHYLELTNHFGKFTSIRN